MQLLHAAMALAAKKIAVHPLQPRSKLPATDHGCKDASTDPGCIAQWWQTRPDYNIGIATGAISGIFALDIDDGGEAALAKLEAAHGALPPTVEVITGGGGRHAWFAHPGVRVKNSVGKLGLGLDVRGDAGYVCGPPSIHPTGRAYAWSVDCAGAIAEAPAWLIHRVTAPDGARTPPISSAEWSALAGEIVDGRRDVTITRVTGHLLRRFVDVRLTLELVRALNRAHCQPPLPDGDIMRIVNSIAKAELKRRGNGC